MIQLATKLGEKRREREILRNKKRVEIRNELLKDAIESMAIESKEFSEFVDIEITKEIAAAFTENRKLINKKIKFQGSEKIRLITICKAMQLRNISVTNFYL